jgi:hypothetical protein
VDNLSVVYNSSVPQSVMKKKSNLIAYHFVRKNAAARVVINVAYEPTATNLADICTKHRLDQGGVNFVLKFSIKKMRLQGKGFSLEMIVLPGFPLVFTMNFQLILSHTIQEQTNPLAVVLV